MSKFRFTSRRERSALPGAGRAPTRRAFLQSSAAASFVGLAACGGGGISTPQLGSNGGGTPTPVPGATATPGSTATATLAPAATATPVATATTLPYPNGTVSNGSRAPGSLYDTSRPAGKADTSLPFDYVVVVMMENHSFDNYFGMLPLRGQPLADGFTFDKNGVPQNKNPLKGGYQHVFHLPSTCQPNGVTQTWSGTRTQIGNGAMDGFAGTDSEAMGYYDESDLPFYYSLAKTFCLGNRAYCSATAQTYPNRRYLYSGTSIGTISTDNSTFSKPAPAGGTLMDVMTKYGVTWKNYFTDLPALAIVPQTLENYPQNFTSVAQFLADCAAGTLPNVSFVDPEFGATDVVGGELQNYLSSVPNLPAAVQTGLNSSNSKGGDEENPQDVAIGEAFVSQIVNAVMNSPLWPRTLLVWTYDEHGGYYDHVPPAAAVLPDAIPPALGPGDPAGQFNITGLRIPTVVVSPYSKPHAVSNVPHDHTSIIATIAAKWNLPALTYRDAQAATLFDYVNFSAPPSFPKAVTLAAPSNPNSGNCTATAPPAIVSPSAAQRRNI